MRGSDKRKYAELIHDFSIQYAIKNGQYPKNTAGRSGCYAQR